MGISDRKIETTQRPIADVTTTSIDAYNNYLKGVEKIREYYWNEAKEFLEKAVHIDSTFAMAYLKLGWVYLELGETKARDKAYEKAKTYSEKATGKERLYIEAAYAEYIEGNPEKKVHILNQMAKRYHKEKLVHLDLGWYYYNRNFFDEAIDEHQKALELDPNYGDALNGLAYGYVTTGNFEKALEYLKRYASVSPGVANPLDTMGEVYFKMGRLEKAIAKYKETLEIKPDFGSEFRIAYIYALKEDYPEAMKWVEQFIDVAPSPGQITEGYLWQGFYHYWLGRYERSLDDLRRAADLAEAIGNERWKASTNSMRGWICYDNGEIESGRRYFKRCYDLNIESYPAFVPYFTIYYSFYLGLVDLKQGRIDSAKARLVEIKSLLPEAKPFSLDRVIFYHDFLNGKLLLAESSLEKAIAVCEKASHREMLFYAHWDHTSL